MAQKMVRFCSESSGVHFVHERVVEILSEGSTLTNGGREKFALGCYKNMFLLASSNPKPRPISPVLSSKLPFTQPTTTDTKSQPKNTSNVSNTIITSYTNAKLVAMVIPVLLLRCREVLQRFVVDDRQSGQCPLPRYRLAEVIFLLRELLYLELPQNHSFSPSHQNAEPEPNPINNDDNHNDDDTNNCNYSTTTDTSTGINSNGKDRVLLSPHRHLIELYPLFCESISSSERDLKDLLKEIFYLVGREFLNVKRL